MWRRAPDRALQRLVESLARKQAGDIDAVLAGLEPSRRKLIGDLVQALDVPKLAGGPSAQGHAASWVEERLAEPERIGLTPAAAEALRAAAATAREGA